MRRIWLSSENRSWMFDTITFKSKSFLLVLLSVDKQSSESGMEILWGLGLEDLIFKDSSRYPQVKVEKT